MQTPISTKVKVNKQTFRKLLTVLLPLLSVLSCTTTEESGSSDGSYTNLSDAIATDPIFRIPKTMDYEPGMPCGYVNQEGDTIVPIGKYRLCFTDTVSTFAIVMEGEGTAAEAIGIDRAGNRLFEIYWYDNGPDYVQDGLFRILRNGKIGFADASGHIVIEPQFACAEPFSDGRARVTFDCELVASGEHRIMESQSWFYIDKTGRKTE